MGMWMIRLRSAGKRYKPVYTNDPNYPVLVRKHFNAFLKALYENQGYYPDPDDFTFKWERGVIKHSTRPYVQIKRTKDRTTPSDKNATYAALLPLFLPTLKKKILGLNSMPTRLMYYRKFSISENEDTFIWHEGPDSETMTIDDGITRLYHEWLKDPMVFKKYIASDTVGGLIDSAMKISRMCGNIFGFPSLGGFGLF